MRNNKRIIIILAVINLVLNLLGQFFPSPYFLFCTDLN